MIKDNYVNDQEKKKNELVKGCLRFFVKNKRKKALKRC